MAFSDASWENEFIWIVGTLPQVFEAGTSIYKGMIVTVSGGKIYPATASDVPIGIACETKNAGEKVAVAIAGSIALVHADGSGITAGHLVGATTVDSVDGYATDLGTTAPSGLGAHPIGVAIENISANSTGKILIC